MNNRAVYLAALGVSILSVVFLACNMFLVACNRDLQSDVVARQDTISRGMGMSRINEALVQALAETNVKSGDAMIRELLTSQGITLTPKKAEAAPAPKDTAETIDTKKNNKN